MYCAIRLVADVSDTPMMNRPVVYSGALSSCYVWCEQRGYKWVKDSNNLFGGYYADKATGDCYLLT